MKNLSSLALIVWLCLFLRIHVLLLNGVSDVERFPSTFPVASGDLRSQFPRDASRLWWTFGRRGAAWLACCGMLREPHGTILYLKPWETMGSHGQPTRILWISYGYPTGFSCKMAIRSLIHRGNLGSPFLDLATPKSSQLTFEARPWGNWGCWGTDGNSRRMGEIWTMMLVIPFVLKRWFHSVGNFIIRTDFHSIIFQRGRYTTNQTFIHSTHPYDFSLYSRMMAVEVPFFPAIFPRLDARWLPQARHKLMWILFHHVPPSRKNGYHIWGS